MKLKTILSASLLGVVASTANAALITGVTVDSFSSSVEGGYDRGPTHLIDGSGLTTTEGLASDTHNNGANGVVWLTSGTVGFNGPVDTDPSVTFDLGASYDLGTTRIWNYNESGFTLHGADQIDITFYLADGTTVAGTQTINVLEGGGSATEAAQDFSTTYSNVQFVQFDIITNHDGDNFATNEWNPGSNEFAGLGEVRFESAAVPEPSSTALLGLGGLALILRRRK